MSIEKLNTAHLESLELSANERFTSQLAFTFGNYVARTQINTSSGIGDFNFVSFSQQVKNTNDYRKVTNIFGGAGNDTINVVNFKSVYPKAFFGGKGKDFITGELDEPNRLFGGIEEDLLKGGNKNDVIFGGKGADILYSGGGNDILTGNRDADRFVINGLGFKTLDDFNTKEGDVLEIDKTTGITDISQLTIVGNIISGIGLTIIFEGSSSTPPLLSEIKFV